MTDHIAPPTDRTEFDQALAAVINTAADNGVDVEGGWKVRNGADSPAWSVEITRVAADGAPGGDGPDGDAGGGD